jgi:O-antigen/teichoic acid export membrane protein
MSQSRRIAKNTLILVLSNVITLFMGLFYTSYTTRYLGVENYGIISIALAWVGIYGPLMDMGLGQLVIRDVSRDPSLIDKYIFNMAALKILITPFIIILVVLAANFLNKGDSATISVVYILAISTGIASFSGIFTSAFQSMEKMEYSSIVSVVNGLCMLVGALLAIRLGLSVIGFAYVYLVASLIIFVYSIATYVIKFSRARAALDIVSWPSMFQEALPFGMADLFAGIFGWISSLILAYTMGHEDVGFYMAPYKLIIILNIIPYVVNISLFPVMCRFYLTSGTMMRFLQTRSFRYTALLGLPMGVGTTLLAEKIIILIFGPIFIKSVIVLQVLIWSSVLIFTSSSFYRLLSTSNYQATVTKLMAVCALEAILLNLILIPQLSYVGASLANVASEGTSLVLSMYAASKIGYSLSKSDLAFMVKVAIASAAMGAFILLVKGLAIHLVLLVASSIIFYFIVSFLLGIFDKEDIAIFKSIIYKGAYCGRTTRSPEDF